MNALPTMNEIPDSIFAPAPSRTVIVVSDEDLRRLGKQLGPDVWQMGSWNSDGVFGYLSVPFIALERAAESLHDENVTQGVYRISSAPERTMAFIELLQSCGAAFVEKIVVAYRECSAEFWFSRQAPFENIRPSN